MLKILSVKLLSVLSIVAVLAACAPTAQRPDYTAFRKSQPRSVLVLPPLNETSDVDASYGMLAQMTQPLAEGGYYVIPVGVMEETFRQNGLANAAEIAEVSPHKLREIFGADAVLYSKVTEYGSVYKVVDSTTVVAASAQLVDLRSGDVLWRGAGRATGKETGVNVGGDAFGIVGMLVQAAVKQVAHSLSDESFEVAGLAGQRLLSVGPPDGLLYGPRSPKHGTD